MKDNTLLWLVLGGGALWYFTMRKPDRAGQVQYLSSWYNSQQGATAQEALVWANKLISMSDGEVSTVYEYIHDYYTKGKNLVQGSDLFNRLMAVSTKYQIFT